jgi:hypothetical protein
MSDHSKFSASVQLAAQIAALGATTAPALANVHPPMPGAVLAGASRLASSAERSREAFAFKGQTVRVAYADPSANPQETGLQTFPPQKAAPQVEETPTVSPNVTEAATAQPSQLFDKYARHVPPEHHARPPVHHHAQVHHTPLPAYCRTDEMKPYTEQTLLDLEGPSTRLTVPSEIDPKTHQLIPIDSSGPTAGADYGRDNNDPKVIPGILPNDIQKIEHYRNEPARLAMKQLNEHPDFISTQSMQNGWRFVTDRLRQGEVEHYQAKTGRNFHSLPTDAQVAIISAATNMSPLWVQAPKLERAIENMDFRQAAREERTGFVDILSRREAEAKFFDRAARCVAPVNGSRPSHSR